MCELARLGSMWDRADGRMLQDGMKEDWDAAYIAQIVQQYIDRNPVSTVRKRISVSTSRPNARS